MDQLDLLKKDWKKQESSLPKLSKEELSKLIHKKSSSIVKWIFIISVLEFVIPHLAYLFVDYDKVIEQYKNLHLYSFNLIATVTIYVIALIFMYLFYKNYTSISANSNPKVLMENIIKTRRTVKYYIWCSLTLIPIIAGVFFYQTFNSPEFIEKLPEDTSMAIVWLITIVLILVLVAVFWLLYQLLYGILLNKLKKNYKELIGNGQKAS